ncbi:unannotated protein [freshwater metagenome]|uniref:Unannotated protein n=1 Tax=freshwater metagenome TaxID=449393 RepID=A0A6J6XW02_9ZZZZ
MLMMPLRSHKIPAIAPRMIGTLRVTVSCNMPVKLNEPPDAAQAKNEMTKVAAAILKTTFVHLPNPLSNCAAPSAISTNASMRAKG